MNSKPKVVDATGELSQAPPLENVNDDDRCPDCGRLLVLVGRMHPCVSPIVTKAPVTKPVTKGHGRPPIGTRPMTAVKRKRRQRAAQRVQAADERKNLAVV